MFLYNSCYAKNRGVHPLFLSMVVAIDALLISENHSPVIPNFTKFLANLTVNTSGPQQNNLLRCKKDSHQGHVGPRKQYSMNTVSHVTIMRISKTNLLKPQTFMHCGACHGQSRV